MLFLLMDMADTPENKKKVEALYHKYDCLMYYIACKILHRHEDIEDAVMELIPDPDTLPEHPAYSRRFNRKIKKINFLSKNLSSVIIYRRA